MNYPKIETLFDRDEETHKVITSQIRRPEFSLIREWLVTEKIDGTNIRIQLNPSEGTVRFGGRTDNAQIPTFLIDHLQDTFTPAKCFGVFDDDMTDVTLFGEGYGARIQKGGGDYREGVSFRLFDVVVVGSEGRSWWLQWKDIEDVAAKLGIQTVPVVGAVTVSSQFPLEALVHYTKAVTGSSKAAMEDGGERQMEGIVARTEPLLFGRRGDRVMWKLKGKDFAQEPPA